MTKKEIKLTQLEVVELKTMLKHRLIDLDFNKEVWKDDQRLYNLNEKDIKICERILKELEKWK